MTTFILDLNKLERMGGDLSHNAEDEVRITLPGVRLKCDGELMEDLVSSGLDESEAIDVLDKVYEMVGQKQIAKLFKVDV